MYDPGISFYQNFPADVFCTTKPIYRRLPKKGNDLVVSRKTGRVASASYVGAVFFNGNLLQLIWKCFPW